MKTKINMLGIFVNDLSQMVSFYRDTLNFEIDWDGNGTYAEFKHDGIRFSFYERKELENLFKPEVSYPSGLNGTFEIAIDFASDQELDDNFERIAPKASNILYRPRLEPWGIRSAMIADPEGNIIELTCLNTTAKGNC